MGFYELIHDKLNYWVAIILIMLGLWAMIGKRNLVKKLVGMVIFQSAIILFFVSMSVKEGATIPILHHSQLHESEHSSQVETEDSIDSSHGNPADAHGNTESLDESPGIDPDEYANPLPHVLMLTAIVVGVATLGVALAIVIKLFEGYGTIEEDEIDERIRLAVKDATYPPEGLGE